MKVLVLGAAGKIGSVVAKDLTTYHDVEEIGIADQRPEQLRKVQEWIGCDRVSTHIFDINSENEAKSVIKQYDVCIVTLPTRRVSYNAIKHSIEVGVHVVDVLEEYHRKPDLYETEGLQLPEGMSLHDFGEWLHVKAIENEVTVLDGMGFAPGLSNVTLSKGIQMLDEAHSAIARVGGVPSKEIADRNPLGYIITWTFEHVLREYMVKVAVIKDGETVEVDAMTDRESFSFNEFGKNETLECVITPGMPSFIYTRPHLREFAEKTIRWPGHWDAMELFKECGMLALEPIEFEGKKIVPRQFLAAVLKPCLLPQDGDSDVCVMWNTVTGIKDGNKIRVEYHMWDEADAETGMSSMSRVTGFPAAIGAVLLGNGDIVEKGIVPPEEGIKGELYDRMIAELGKRGIIIKEKIVTLK